MIPKISVIVPVYNANKGLRRCVDSILAQTYVNFELLLINDGSTDGSNEICDEYAKKDVRVRVFHKRNGGVSSARNIGLENATGEWISFVDSDDWVRESYLKHLYDEVQGDVDLVIAFAEMVNHPDSDKYYYEQSKLNKKDFSELFVKFDLSWRTAPWGKLFRSELIKSASLRFVEGMHIGEDACFLYEFILHCRNILISDKKDYFYLYDNCGSLTKRSNSIDSELLAYNEIYKVMRKLIDRLQINDPIALKNMRWSEATYLQRVLNSLYNKVDRKRRIQVLGQLDYRSLDYYVRTNVKFVIQRMLLKNRMFRIYDTLRYLTK